MKWTDIRNRFQKNTSAPIMQKNDASIANLVTEPGKDSHFKKIFFPLIVIVVIIAAVAIVYWFINHRTADPIETIQLNSEEVSAVQDFFQKNPAQPIQKKDITQIKNILDGTTPAAEPASPAKKPAAKK